MLSRPPRYAPILGLVGLLAAIGCDGPVVIETTPVCRQRGCELFDGIPDSPSIPFCPDPEPGTLVDSASMRLATIVPTSADGFNVDGINNAPRGGTGGGSGKTIPGCNASDAPFGKDVAFANAVAAVAPVVAFGSARLVDPGTDSARDSFIRLLDLDRADQATFNCAEVGLAFGVSEPPALLGSGALRDHVMDAAFGVTVELEFRPTPAPDSCDGPCVDAPLRVFLDRPVGRFAFDEQNTRLVGTSHFGGFFFFFDDSDTDETRNDAGLLRAIERYAAEAHLTSSARDLLIDAFEAVRDLHQNDDGTITPCTAPGGNASLVNRNAISVALAITGD